MEWTGAEQKALEHALSVVAKDLPPTERWQQIGTMVEGRTAKECVARYKELADAAKKKKADAAEAAEAERAAIKKAEEAAAAEAKKKAEAAAHKKRAEEEFVAQQACAPMHAIALPSGAVHSVVASRQSKRQRRRRRRRRMRPKTGLARRRSRRPRP